MDPRLDKARESGSAEAVAETRTATNQFVIDAALLASSLAAISMRNEKCRIAEEVETGFRSYADLLHRKQALRLTDEDDVALNYILQQIRRRLNYLKVWRLRPACEPHPGSE